MNINNVTALVEQNLKDVEQELAEFKALAGDKFAAICGGLTAQQRKIVGL